MITKEDVEFVERAKLNFSYFLKYIFPLSFKEYKEPSHLYSWSDRIQYNKKTATLSARKHLKSTLMYAYIMWKIFRMEQSDDWLYMSYTEPLSRYHTRNIKKLIFLNPFFEKIIDLTNAESSIRYTWNNKDMFSILPASISRFNRGWHGAGIICDDILADPTSELNPTIIQTITHTFFEEVMSLPIEGGEIHLVGTAQHQEDVFFQIKNKSPSFNWEMYPAIVSEVEGKTIWPEMFPIDRLIQIRDEELGEKAFNKEYMCSPVWTEDAYFKRTDILDVCHGNLRNMIRFNDPDSSVIAGFDIGKSRHPSHIVVFALRDNKWTNIYQQFLDNWDYTKQIAHLNYLCEVLNIKKIYYDATRGEIESFLERGEISRSIWRAVRFTHIEKARIAANFQRVVINGRISLINDGRLIRSILSVTKDLEALETNEGHGDAFWSIAMALSHTNVSIPTIVGGGRFK